MSGLWCPFPSRSLLGGHVYFFTPHVAGVPLTLLTRELICEDGFDQPVPRYSKTEKLVSIRLDFRYDLDKASLRNSQIAFLFQPGFQAR